MEAMNPYAAPRSPAPRVEQRAAFSPAAVAAHTVVLTPVVGVLMAASNWIRCGERGRAARVVFVYGFPMGALLAARLLTEHESLSGLALILSIVIAFALHADQRELWDVHARHEPLVLRRWWVATLYGVFGIAVLGAALAAVGGAGQ